LRQMQESREQNLKEAEKNKFSTDVFLLLNTSKTVQNEILNNIEIQILNEPNNELTKVLNI
jgi:hypothetical protein